MKKIVGLAPALRLFQMTFLSTKFRDLYLLPFCGIERPEEFLKMQKKNFILQLKLDFFYVPIPIYRKRYMVQTDVAFSIFYCYHPKPRRDSISRPIAPVSPVARKMCL
jgi:hypothetical protein